VPVQSWSESFQTGSDAEREFFCHALNCGWLVGSLSGEITTRHGAPAATYLDEKGQQQFLKAPDRFIQKNGLPMTMVEVKCKAPQFDEKFWLDVDRWDYLKGWCHKTGMVGLVAFKTPTNPGASKLSYAGKDLSKWVCATLEYLNDFIDGYCQRGGKARDGSISFVHKWYKNRFIPLEDFLNSNSIRSSIRHNIYIDGKSV
jgi:hypothetical protein